MLMKWPEIREVKNPVSPAVAFTEHGRTVVEVDEKLKGKARAAAIWAAVRMHEHGLAALVGLPIVAFAWEPLKRWGRNHPGAAMGATAAAGSALTAGAVLLLPMVLDGAEHPNIAEPPITVTATPVWPSQNPPITREPKLQPTHTPTTSATTTQEWSRPTARPAIQTVTHPTRKPTRSARPQPTATKEPPKTRAPEAPAPTSEVSADPTPPPATRQPPPPTPPPSGDASSAEPPAPTAAGGDCLLRVDLDPLLEVCALG